MQRSYVDFEICTVSLIIGGSLSQEYVHPADLQNNSDILFLSSHIISLIFKYLVVVN